MNRLATLKELDECFLCSGNCRFLFSLQQSLNECDQMTVLQILQIMHFVSISDDEELDGILCCICMANLLSSYQLKQKCDLIENEWNDNPTIESLPTYNSTKSKDNQVEPNEPHSEMYEVWKMIEENEQNASNSLENQITTRKPRKTYGTRFRIKNEKVLNSANSPQKRNRKLGIRNSKKTKSDDLEDLIPYTKIGTPTSNVVVVEDFISLTKIGTQKINTAERITITEAPSINYVYCDICGESFGDMKYLLCHKAIHLPKKVHECNICNETFCSPCLLSKHKKAHKNDRQYMCDVCDMVFTKSDDLRNHKTIHLVRKPYVCDICNESYRFLSNLEDHKRIHGNRKLYNCNICGKSFNQPSALTVHKGIHVDNKRHVCDVCHASYRFMRNLVEHKKMHL